MKTLVTGSAGHLGEALVRTLRQRGDDVVGIDLLPSPFTDHTGSIANVSFVCSCLAGVDTVYHAATLHKPHVATHSKQEFIDSNITGTLNLLEAAAKAGVKQFIYTSTTSVFGDALVPPPGKPAAWIDESVVPVPKNIYGVTKFAAEHLCQLFSRNHGLPCIVLRTSRFFPEEDDDPQRRAAYSADNLKVIEFLYRRVEIEDAVSAHLLAADHAVTVGFGTFIVSATTPFSRSDADLLRVDAPAVLRRILPSFEAIFAARGWGMTRSLHRVYDNARARADLGWQPQYDFGYILGRLAAGLDYRSPLTQEVGSKGYHNKIFDEGPFPV